MSSHSEPASRHSEPASLQALLETSAFAPIHNLGWLRITGEDRVRWLNGMTTNNIAALKPGEGCYTFFLNAQGRIQADAYAWMLEDSILLESEAGGIPTLIAYLDRFIIMDDVELENHSMDGTGLVVLGPQSESLLEQIGFAADLPPMHFAQELWPHDNGPVPVRRIHTDGPLTPHFELWSDPATIGLLAESLRATGAIEATPESLTQLRILAGIPLFGTDIRNTEAARDLPQETAPSGSQSRALHFSKGCYLGQEIVERIHSRGNVHRSFSGFLLTGDLPPAGTTLATSEAPDKPLGELTSIARVGDRILALGYIRREAMERRVPLLYAGGTASVCALPFSLPAA